MKILHIITGLGNGGAEAVLYRLVTHDPADTHHVLSLTDSGKYGAALAEAGIAVTTLNMPRRRVTLGGMLRLWHTLRRARPDVVQTWMYHADLLGGIAGWLAGVPVIWCIRNTTLDAKCSTRATIWIARVCARLSRRIPQRIVCCAEKARTVHASLGYGVRRMTVIPNGYDLTRFAPNAEARRRLRAEWEIGDMVPLLGMVGRFDPQKDHQNLIAALAQLQAARQPFAVVFAGTDMTAENTALKGWIASAGLTKQVRLLGPRSDIPAVMSALDVHVLSSAYGEAFPNVLAEAMACGTPCVTTDLGDAALIVGDTGWVVPPQNPHELAAGLIAALKALGDAPGWRERQQRARRRISDEFSIDKMVRHYRAVWQETADKKKL